MKKWQEGYLKHIEESIKIIEDLKDNWIFLGESDLVGVEPLLEQSDYNEQIDDEMSEKMQLKNCLMSNELGAIVYKMNLHKIDFLEDIKEK